MSDIYDYETPTLVMLRATVYRYYSKTLYLIIAVSILADNSLLVCKEFAHANRWSLLYEKYRVYDS